MTSVCKLTSLSGGVVDDRVELVDTALVLVCLYKLEDS